MFEINTKYNKQRFVFIVSYDWRDIFHTNKKEYYEKLQRDQLCPEINKFFFFSWNKKTYSDCDGNWCTTHKKTYGLEKLRPLLNLRALFSIPYAVYKHGVRPDVWVVYDFGMAPAVWIASKLYGGVLIMMVNNNPKECSATRKFGKIKKIYSWCAERIGVRFVKYFFTLNEYMRTYLMSLGVDRKCINIYTVNTIKRDMEYIKKAKIGSIRKRYKISDDKKIILTVARLEEEKNYPLLLELFSGLSKKHVLFCLGEGSMLKELQKKASDLNIEERVFFEGNIERNKIWNYYKDADVMVLLSKAEALGIVFWEAMYMNVPTIGSDVEGIIESLGKNGERGMVWRQKDGQKGFNDIVSFCVTESGERDIMVSNAKEFVDDKLFKNKNTINDFLDRLDVDKK